MGTCHTLGAGKESGVFTQQLQPLFALLGLVHQVHSDLLSESGADATINRLSRAWRAVFSTSSDPAAPARSAQATLLCLWPADPVLQQAVVRVLAPASCAVTTFSTSSHSRGRNYSILDALAPHNEACTGHSCGVCFGLFVLWAWLLSVAPSGTLSAVYYRLRLDPYPRTRAHSSELLQFKANVLSRGSTSISGAVQAAQCRKLSRVLSRPRVGGLPSMMSRGELLHDTEFAELIDEFTLQCLVDMQRKVQGWLGESVWVGAPLGDARARASSPSFRTTMLHVLVDLVREPVPKPARRQSITARLAAKLAGGHPEPRVAEPASAQTPASVLGPVPVHLPVHAALVNVLAASAMHIRERQRPGVLVIPAAMAIGQPADFEPHKRSRPSGWASLRKPIGQRMGVTPFDPSSCFQTQAMRTDTVVAAEPVVTVENTLGTRSLSDIMRSVLSYDSSSEVELESQLG